MRREYRGDEWREKHEREVGEGGRGRGGLKYDLKTWTLLYVRGDESNEFSKSVEISHKQKHLKTNRTV